MDADEATVLTNTVQCISRAASAHAPRPQQTPAPPTPGVKPLSGIGLNTHLRDLFYYLNKNEVIFSLGKHVVVQNVHNQRMAFFEPPGETTESVVAGDVSALGLTSKRNYLAVARGSPSVLARSTSTIAIYSLRDHKAASDAVRTPVRVITYQTHSFVSLAFSANGKFLLGQSSTANWSFVLWDWTRARKIAVTEVHTRVTRVHFNPIDFAQMSTSGGMHLRLWKLAEPTCRQFATFTAPVKYVEHAWIPKSDGLVALLENGDVQHIYNGELVRTLPSLHHGHYLSVVIAGNDGYISLLDVGEVETSGAIADLSLSRRMQLESREPILAIGIDPTGAALMVVTPSLYGAYELANLCLLRGDDESIALVTYAPLPRPVDLSTMTTALRRHVFATLGRAASGGHAIALYSQDGTPGLLQYTFPHLAPNAIAVHPSGFEVLVTFSVQLQVYHVLFDTFKIAFEVEIRHATSVAYSRGGSFFCALVEDRSIYVYSNYAGSEPLLHSVCRGKDVISAFAWGTDETRLYAGDERGNFSEWALTDAGFASTPAAFRDDERTRAYTAIATTHRAGHRVLAAAFLSGTGVAAIHVWPTLDLTVVPDRTPELDAKITALEFCGTALCVGLASGTLHVYWWEDGLAGPRLVAQPLTFDLTAAPLVSLRACSAEGHLLAASADGCVFETAITVASTPELQAATSSLVLQTTYTAINSFVTVVPTDDLCLVERCSVTERLMHIADLETEMDQLKIEKEIVNKLNAEQRSLLERERHADVRAVRTALEAQVHAAHDALTHEKQEAETLTAALKETHARDTSAMQAILSTQIETLHDVVAQLELDLIKARQSIDDATFAGDERAMQLRKALEASHAGECNGLRAEIHRLNDALALKTRAYDEVLSQQDDDHLFHLASLQATIEAERANGAAVSVAAKDTTSNLQQQLRMMLNALDIKSADVEKLTREKHDLAAHVAMLQTELAAERKHAVKTAADCSLLETQVIDLTRSLDGLERLNNIRLCKLKTIKDSLAAKDAANEAMQSFVDELHHENSNVIRDANALDEKQNLMTRKLRFYEQTLAAHKASVADANAIVLAFRRDLGILIEDEQRGKRLKIDAIVKLYHKYEPSARHVTRERGTDEAIIHELTRQNKCVEDHRRKLRSRVATVVSEKHKLATLFSQDNQKLLEDVHRLTRENHELKRRPKSWRRCRNLRRPSSASPTTTTTTTTMSTSPMYRSSSNPRPMRRVAFTFRAVFTLDRSRS
ncbi:hypothetical protein SPRG_03994 [Saprolegnia parasitica CBS 223.65]|uniref:Cilia- and flagella-associated protein 43 n=1 Tax=Saprolegnia parasitica (strain CBS 223.65) TaxID=695850 RepID=A0A067CX47_SAPPC|nr:hypothetical protein SPRG_03994 [Saprolegnia parasitica CBS 223.65]KDO31377.1 hypothetical protein SPRG_03994 [Saprolegnia parasitica CBS 223.65]|eukprot:XP_012197974.1 hypothetical protein SPRG_03994 [Saprolegnia parasitica CBS 223.65]